MRHVVPPPVPRSVLLVAATLAAAVVSALLLLWATEARAPGSEVGALDTGVAVPPG